MRLHALSVLIMLLGSQGAHAFFFNVERVEDDGYRSRAQDYGRKGTGEAKVFVSIDKTQQKVTIVYPDPRDPRKTLMEVDDVSTGGGPKIPNNPASPRPGYCADTPNYERLVIRASEYTMYEMYESNAFLNKAGERVPMAHAIRVKDGIFLHAAPPGDERFLGRNVSAGCIRLRADMAAFLFDLMKQYGAIEVNVFGDNPPSRKECVVENGVPAWRDKSQVEAPRTVSAPVAPAPVVRPSALVPNVPAAPVVKPKVAPAPPVEKPAKKREFLFGPDEDDEARLAAPRIQVAAAAGAVVSTTGRREDKTPTPSSTVRPTTTPQRSNGESSDTPKNDGFFRRMMTWIGIG